MLLRRGVNRAGLVTGAAIVWAGCGGEPGEPELLEVQPGTFFHFQDIGWSPDASRLVFSAGRFTENWEGDLDLYAIDPDGSNLVQLIENDESDVWGSWSPDGRHIVFHSGRAGADDTIYIMNADGSGQRRLVTPEVGGIFPNWLPGSDSVAFATDDGLYVVSASGGDASMLIPGGIFAAWSPDGSRVAYIAERDGRIGVYVMNADQSGNRLLIERPGSCG